MPSFANQIKSEISRLAKKEARQETATLKKTSAHHRSEIAALKKRISELESLVKKITKQVAKPSKQADPETDQESLRWRVTGFVNLRKKLALSADQMGSLLGVSGQSIYKWEQGKAKPRATQLRAIAEVRKMGKRKANARLAELAE